MCRILHRHFLNFAYSRWVASFCLVIVVWALVIVFNIMLKKSLSQNLIKDKKILRRMVELADVTGG